MVWLINERRLALFPAGTIARDPRPAASWIWTCVEPEFRFCWIKLWSNDNHYTTAPWLVNTLPIFIDISLQMGQIVITNKKIKESN